MTLTVIMSHGPVSGSTPEVLCKRIGCDDICADDLESIRSANRRGVPIYADICPYGQEIWGVNSLMLDENLERLEETVYWASQDI